METFQKKYLAPFVKYQNIKLLGKVRLKNSNAERRRSRSLAFGICAVNEASVHKLAKAFEGSRQYILSCEKLPPDKFQMRPFGQGNRIAK